MQKIPICPYCKKVSELKDSSVVYGKSYGMIWICEPCDAYVGVHKNSEEFKPLGSLANRELRELRKKCHAIFDPFWQSGRMSRKEAYRRLARKLNINVKHCHMAWFREDKCKEVLGLLSQPIAEK